MAAQRNGSKSRTTATARILWRPRAWLGLVILVVAGLAGHFAWRQFAAAIAAHPQLQLTTDRIHITPPPPWIHSDIKAEVVRDAGLDEGLSLLSDGDLLSRRIGDAFRLHPWVAAVKRIQANLPASLDIELEYRHPVAAVEFTGDGSPIYLPIDGDGVRLPEGDFTAAQRRFLPRISGVSGRPVVGQPWDDPRVPDGARLVEGLAEVWNRLRLVEVVPSPHPQVRGDARYFTFELVTSGGTRVVWGAAPGAEQDARESPFNAKRERLLDYEARHGELDSIDGPAIVDVRSELVITPRTARRPEPLETESAPIAK